MDNEQGTQEYWAEQAEERFKRYGTEKRYLLADALREFHEELLPELSGFALDLMNLAIGEVNWLEIAESLINDAKEMVET